MAALGLPSVPTGSAGLGLTIDGIDKEFIY
jgi:hypothetical protein